MLKSTFIDVTRYLSQISGDTARDGLVPPTETILQSPCYCLLPNTKPAQCSTSFTRMLDGKVDILGYGETFIPRDVLRKQLRLYGCVCVRGRLPARGHFGPFGVSSPDWCAAPSDSLMRGTEVTPQRLFLAVTSLQRGR